MKKETKIFNVIKAINPGVFTRISYKSDLPISAEYKHKGYKIIKYSSLTTRLGINYHNIKEIKDKESTNREIKNTRKSNMHYVVDKYVLQNNSTGDKYLVTYPTKSGSNAKSVYYLFDNNGNKKEMNKEQIKNYIIPSYWNKQHSNQISIKFDNILSINGFKFN